MATNGARNLDIGSKATPILSECRDVQAGIANGDFNRVNISAGILGLSALAGAGGQAAKSAAAKAG